MERIKIATPATFHFSTVLNIRVTDLNYGGHVGNQVFLSLVHEARLQFLQHFGYSELAFEGIGLIMANAAIEYKRELNHRDEVKISVAAGGVDRIGFDIFYLLEVKVDDQWLPAAKVKTGMTCFDYATKKRVPVPPEAIKKLRM